MGRIDDYTLNSKFDADKHKETFINYLEVLITEDGEVLYAVPSHQELAIKLALKKHGITRNQLDAMCPKEYYCDFMTWVLMQTGAIAVWNNFFVGEANEKQKEILKMLKEKGVYKG